MLSPKYSEEIFPASKEVGMPKFGDYSLKIIQELSEVEEMEKKLEKENKVFQSRKEELLPPEKIRDLQKVSIGNFTREDKRFLEFNTPQENTNAWRKMLELCQRGEIIPEGSEIKHFDMCGLPGTFVMALNYYVRSETKKKYDWYLQSYLPFQDGKKTGMLEDKFKLKQYNPDRFIYYRNGDISSPEEFDFYKEFFKDRKRNLITSDCGLEKKDGSREDQMTKIFFGQFITGLACLSRGGNYFMKYYNFFSPFNVSLVYLMTQIFEKVKLVKPAFSRQFSGKEIYFLCLGYRENLTEENFSFLREKLVNFSRDDMGRSLVKIFSESEKNYCEIIQSILAKFFRKKIDLINERYKFVEKKIGLDWTDDYDEYLRRKKKLSWQIKKYEKKFFEDYYKQIGLGLKAEEIFVRVNRPDTIRFSFRSANFIEDFEYPDLGNYEWLDKEAKNLPPLLPEFPRPKNDIYGLVKPYQLSSFSEIYSKVYGEDTYFMNVAETRKRLYLFSSIPGYDRKFSTRFLNYFEIKDHFPGKDINMLFIFNNLFRSDAEGILSFRKKEGKKDKFRMLELSNYSTELSKETDREELEKFAKEFSKDDLENIYDKIPEYNPDMKNFYLHKGNVEGFDMVNIEIVGGGWPYAKEVSYVNDQRNYAIIYQTFKILNNGGMLLFHIKDIFYKADKDLITLLAYVFEEVYIFKGSMMNATRGFKDVVCKGYNQKKGEEVMPGLGSVVKKWEELDSTYATDMNPRAKGGFVHSVLEDNREVEKDIYKFLAQEYWRRIDVIQEIITAYHKISKNRKYIETLQIQQMINTIKFLRRIGVEISENYAEIEKTLEKDYSRQLNIESLSFGEYEKCKKDLGFFKAIVYMDSKNSRFKQEIESFTMIDDFHGYTFFGKRVSEKELVSYELSKKYSQEVKIFDRDLGNRKESYAYPIKFSELKEEDLDKRLYFSYVTLFKPIVWVVKLGVKKERSGKINVKDIMSNFNKKNFLIENPKLIREDKILDEKALNSKKFLERKF